MYKLKNHNHKIDFTHVIEKLKGNYYLNLEEKD